MRTFRPARRTVSKRLRSPLYALSRARCAAVAAAALAFGLAGVPAPVPAQASVPSTLVQAVPGAGSVVLAGTLKGPNLGARDYVVRVEGGRTMKVQLDTKAPDTWFAVFDPYGGRIHANEGDRRPAWSGQLPEPGEYRVRVYLGGEASRQARAASYTLKIGVDPGA